MFEICFLNKTNFRKLYSKYIFSALNEQIVNIFVWQFQMHKTICILLYFFKCELNISHQNLIQAPEN